MERGWGYPILDGYGDETINSNSSGIGYEYGDILRSRDKGLGRQYSYPTRLIPMSTHALFTIVNLVKKDRGERETVMKVKGTRKKIRVCLI